MLFSVWRFCFGSATYGLSKKLENRNMFEHFMRQNLIKRPF